MPGYQVRSERVQVDGADALLIRLLLDPQQFADPLGEAEALGISSASWPFFGMLWPAGLHLAAAIARRPVRAGERLLEVGCGLAVASLVAHRRGAEITASDIHPLAGDFLRHNLRLNNLPPMPYCHGDWGVPERERLPSPHGGTVRGRFDLIVGSDVLYERDDAGLLPRFIGEHATPSGEVMIVDPKRGNRSAFARRMAVLGYEVQQASIRDPLGPGGPAGGRLFRYRRGRS